MAPRLVFVFLVALAVVSSVRSDEKVRDAVRQKRGLGYRGHNEEHGGGYSGHDDGYGKGGNGRHDDGYGGGYSGRDDGYGKGGYGGHDDGYGKGGYGGHDDGYGKGGYGGHDDGYGKGGYGGHDGGYGKGGYGGHDGGYGRGYGGNDGGYGKGGYGGHDDGYGGYGGNDDGYGKGGYGGYEYTEHHSVKPIPVKTTVTKTVTKQAGSPKADDNKNNVQMSLSYICNTKMQSKDEEGYKTEANAGTGYDAPHARKAEDPVDGAYEDMPMYHHPSSYDSSSDSYSSSESYYSSSGSSSSGKSSRLYIRRPRYEQSSVPSQHIGPNMDIACAGSKANFL